MRVLGYDPILSHDACEKMNIEPVSLDQIYELSDFITVHTPLNDKTRNLLNSNTI